MKLFEPAGSKPLLVVFSHLRWDFVFQRPQHLLTRAAQDFDVVFIEEPIFEGSVEMWRESSPYPGVHVVQPLVPMGTDPDVVLRLQESLVDVISFRAGSGPVCLWYYTPLAYAYSRNIPADLLIFDKMDELSAFAFAPAGLAELETALINVADLVFTGGASLHAAAKDRSASVYCFPSSIDAMHFSQARGSKISDPSDQNMICGPRMGFAGVIDERMNLELIAEVAEASPDLNLIMIGPTAKIDPATLPQAANIHWLGPKDYSELPSYMAHWDLAWMPFALNEATRFISPTKTPEFLAAGLPVISTSIRDVIEPYGRLGLVEIADTVSEIIARTSALLASSKDPQAMREKLAAIDMELSRNSWDKTWRAMRTLIEQAANVIPTSKPAALKQEVRHV